MNGTANVMTLLEGWCAANNKDFHSYLSYLTVVNYSPRINWKDFYWGAEDMEDEDCRFLAEKTGISADFWLTALHCPEDENEIPEDFPTE